MMITRMMLAAFVVFYLFLSGCGVSTICHEGKATEGFGRKYEDRLTQGISQCATTGGWVAYDTCCPDGEKDAQIACLEQKRQEGNEYVLRIELGQTILPFCEFMGTAAGKAYVKTIDVITGIKTDTPIVIPTPNDRDMDSVVDADDLCPDEAQGAMPDPNRKGCPTPTTPAVRCSALVRDMADPTTVCVQDPSTSSTIRTYTWDQGIFDQPETGIMVKKGTGRVFSGILVLDNGGSFWTGTFELCTVHNVCTAITGKDKTGYAVGRPGDYYTSVKVGSSAQVRLVYIQPNGTRQSDPCALMNGVCTPPQ